MKQKTKKKLDKQLKEAKQRLEREKANTKTKKAKATIRKSPIVHPAVREARLELNRFYAVIGTKKISEMECIATLQCGHFVRVLKRIIEAE